MIERKHSRWWREWNAHPHPPGTKRFEQDLFERRYPLPRVVCYNGRAWNLCCDQFEAEAELWLGLSAGWSERVAGVS